MNSWQWLGIASVLMALAAAAFFVCKIEIERRMYRLLWMLEGKRREMATAELGEYVRTSWSLNEALAKAHVALGKLRRDYTRQAETIDSLLHGDRTCVLRHRYHTGQGVSCPHCGAAEVGRATLRKMTPSQAGDWVLMNMPYND